MTDKNETPKTEASTTLGQSDSTALVMLPMPAGIERMETSATQFGDDWPGVFIRGDNAFALGQNIENMCEVLHAGGELSMVSIKYLESAAKFLKSCKAT